MNDRQEDDNMSYSGDKKEILGIKRFVMRRKKIPQGERGKGKESRGAGLSKNGQVKRKKRSKINKKSGAKYIQSI